MHVGLTVVLLWSLFIWVLKKGRWSTNWLFTLKPAVATQVILPILITCSSLLMDKVIVYLSFEEKQPWAMNDENFMDHCFASKHWSVEASSDYLTWRLLEMHWTKHCGQSFSQYEGCEVAKRKRYSTLTTCTEVEGIVVKEFVNNIYSTIKNSGLSV